MEGLISSAGVPVYLGAWLLERLSEWFSEMSAWLYGFVEWCILYLFHMNTHPRVARSVFLSFARVYTDVSVGLRSMVVSADSNSNIDC